MAGFLVKLFANKLQEICVGTVAYAVAMREAGEILSECHIPSKSTEIPERLIQLSSTILTEMELIGKLLKSESEKEPK